MSSHLHYGFNAGFMWSVFSRPVVSCPLGVARVALCMFIVYFVSASVCVYARLLVGKLADDAGVNMYEVMI